MARRSFVAHLHQKEREILGDILSSSHVNSGCINIGVYLLSGVQVHVHRIYACIKAGGRCSYIAFAACSWNVALRLKTRRLHMHNPPVPYMCGKITAFYSHLHFHLFFSCRFLLSLLTRVGLTCGCLPVWFSCLPRWFAWLSMFVLLFNRKASVAGSTES